MPKPTRGRKRNKTSVPNPMTSVGEEKFGVKRKASVEWNSTHAMPTASKNQPKISKQTSTVAVAENKPLNQFDFRLTQSQAKPLDTQELQNIRKAITAWKPPTRKTACSEALKTQTPKKDKTSKVSKPHTVSSGIWRPPLRTPTGTVSQTIQQAKNLSADIREKHCVMETGNEDVETSMDSLQGGQPTMKHQQTSVTQLNSNSTVTKSFELLGVEKVLVQKTRDVQHKDKTESVKEVIQMCPEKQVASLTSDCIQEKLATGGNEIKEDSDDEIFYFRPNTKSVVDDIHSDSDESVIENSQPTVDKVSQMSKISRPRATPIATEWNKEAKVVENVELTDVAPISVTTSIMNPVSTASSLHTPPNNPEIDFSKCPQLKRDSLRRFIYELPVEPLQTQVIPEYYEERDLFGTQEDPVGDDMPPSKKAKIDKDVSDDWITKDCIFNADIDMVTPPFGEELSFSQCSTLKREDTEDNEMQEIIKDADASDSFAEKVDILQEACRTIHETESVECIRKALSDLSDVFPTDNQESRIRKIITEAMSTGNDMDVCESVIHKSQESNSKGQLWSMQAGHPNKVYATDNDININQDEDTNASNVNLPSSPLITEQGNAETGKKEMQTSSQELQSLNDDATASDLTPVITSQVPLDNEIKDVTTGNVGQDKDVLHVNQEETKGENEDIGALTSNDLLSNDTHDIVASSLNCKCILQKQGLGFDHPLMNSVLCDKQTEEDKQDPLTHSTDEQECDHICHEEEDVSCTHDVLEHKAGNDMGFKPSKTVHNELVSNNLQPSSTQIHTTQQPDEKDVQIPHDNKVEMSAAIIDDSNVVHTVENVLETIDLEPCLVQICSAPMQPDGKEVHVPQEKIDKKQEEEISEKILKESSNVKTKPDKTEPTDLLLPSTEKPTNVQRLNTINVISSQPEAKGTAEDKTQTMLEVNVNQEQKGETAFVSQQVAKETEEDKTMTLKVNANQEQKGKTAFVSQQVAKEIEKAMTLEVNANQEPKGETALVSQPVAKEIEEDKTMTLKENGKEQKNETTSNVAGNILNIPKRNEERNMIPLTVELSQDFEFSYSQMMQIENDYKKEMKREATRKPPVATRTEFTPREGTVAPGPGNASLQCGNAQLSSPYVPMVNKMPQMKWMKAAEDDRKKLRAVIADISKLNAMLLQVRRTVWPANGNPGVAPLNAASRPMAGDVMQPGPSGSTQLVACDVTQPAQSSVSRLTPRSTIHPGQSNVIRPGHGGLNRPGQINVPQTDSRALQYSGMPGNVNHPGQVNAHHPGMGTIPHPGQANITHPGQGNVPHPGQGNVPHPGLGSVFHPRVRNMPHPGQSYMPRPSLGNKPLPDPGTRRY